MEPKGKPYCKLDEDLNSLGPNRCSTDDECEGTRTCSAAGWCQFDVLGVDDSGCIKKLGQSCELDEAKNSRGQNRCSKNRHCAGNR